MQSRDLSLSHQDQPKSHPDRTGWLCPAARQRIAGNAREWAGLRPAYRAWDKQRSLTNLTYPTTRLGTSSPAKNARKFSTAISPISVRTSNAAVPKCGNNETFDNARSASGTSGSFS